MTDLPSGPSCGNCRHFERPPANMWPGSAFGACMNDKNVSIGPSGWNSGTARPVVSDMQCCTNFERVKD